MSIDCDQANERLPWLLNGTLEPDERRQVLAHVAGCERCRHALAETRLAWQAFDAHLPAEVLTALAADEDPGASGIDRGVAERHLADCPQCAAELEMVRASRALLENEAVATPFAPRAGTRAPAAGRAWRNAALAAGLAGVVAATGWYGSSREVRSLEARLESPAPPAPVEPAPVPDPAHGDAGLSALQEENERLRQDLARQRQEAAERIARLEQGSQAVAGKIAAVNTQVIDVYPETQMRGEEGGGNRLELAQPAELYTLLLHPGEAPERAEVEIADAAGRVVWKSGGLVKSSNEDYTLTLGRDLLPPGSYTLTLYRAGAGGQRTRLETFPLTLR